MQQLGKPKLMLFLDVVKTHPSGRDPVPLAGGHAVTVRIMDTLTEAGFTVKDRDRFEFLKEHGKLNSRDDDRFNLYKMTDQDFGAHLYVEGEVTATGPVPRSEFHHWNAEGWLKVCWSDSGDILAAVPQHREQKNYRDPGDGGASELVDIVAEVLAEKLRAKLLEQLARRALEGVSMTVKIDGLQPRQMFAIEDRMKTFEGITRVSPGTVNESAVQYEVQGKSLASTLYRQLTEANFADFVLSDPKLQGHTLSFTAKKKR